MVKLPPVRWVSLPCWKIMTVSIDIDLEKLSIKGRKRKECTDLWGVVVRTIM